MGTVTELLHQARQGDRPAFDRLFAHLYPELKRIAHARLCADGPPRALDTTALVHECYLKLLSTAQLAPADRAHFLAYGARVMRSVIVDTVRAARRQRRGGDAAHVTLDTALAGGLPAGEDEILDVDAALAEMERLDARLVRIVEMRYFVGLKDAEIASALGITDRTVRRDWAKARLLLAAALRG